MSRLLIVEPVPIAGVTASRGSGAGNLATVDPKEVWADAASGSPATLTVDLGVERLVDTVLVGHVRPPAAGATWSITGGASADAAVIQPVAPLRVPDVAGTAPAMSHALWTGAARPVRRLAISLSQAAGEAPLTAGVLVIGQSFAAELGQEWGGGRRPVDTGTMTPLASGGFSTVEGARKSVFSWTFGDLSAAEADRIELIALALGETRPGLVIEDDARTPGLRSRIHYGLFQRWKAFERKNRRQTRWEIAIEQWT